jgi:hypothetical protein
MRRRLLAVVVVATALAACGRSDEAGTTERTAAAPAPKTTDDLARNSAHRTLKIPGESFVLTVDYYLTSYDATKWQTLAAKYVTVSVHVKPTGGPRHRCCSDRPTRGRRCRRSARGWTSCRWRR